MFHVFSLFVIISLSTNEFINPQTLHEFSENITLEDLQGEWTTNFGNLFFTVKGTVLFMDGIEDVTDGIEGVVKETYELFVVTLYDNSDWVLMKNSTTLRWKNTTDSSQEDVLWYSTKETSVQPEKNEITNTQTLHEFSENITLQDLQGEWDTNGPGVSFTVKGTVIFMNYQSFGAVVKETLKETYESFIFPGDYEFVLMKNSTTLRWKNTTDSSQEDMLWYSTKKSSSISRLMEIIEAKKTSVQPETDNEIKDTNMIKVNFFFLKK